MTLTRQSDPHLDAPIALDDVGPRLAVELYARMALIRAFEQRASRLFLQGRLPGTIHLSLGQEACAAGAAAALRPDDWITITHRGHGQALAKGVTPRRLMAELFGRETGCCRGRGGSLHVGDIAVGALPAIAIVGAAVPIAAGVAFAFRWQGTDRVALSFLGDGAMFEGDTHEGLNLATLWELPVVYLCENNLYSVSTPLTRQTRITHLAELAAAYGMTSVTIDGNNACAVYLAAREAVARARGGGGPTFVECLTYRQGGHKRDDPATYRSPEEVAAWMARDPLVRMRAALDQAGEAAAVARADKEAEAAVDDAVEFAASSPAAQAGPA
ncbi:MAG TPA: thiamine pyrophosphate-dependent dehydrogenase E1 component subunit alpha [Actinomycetes bacterium]|jgi:pyruvate dehydrogenase E1 component alpha subunit|nr:thiamine pyrophosphate-dependent dehydrogenase E1 component subunit alpha [Actinomycetes bacterium]